MKNIIGVKFEKPRKIYFFDPGELKINKDDFVVVDSETGEVLVQNERTEVAKVASKKTVDKVQELMWGAVNSDEVMAASTAYKTDIVTTIGKTGTAQERNDRTNHAVFVSFAPQYAPEIAVNVVIPFGYSSGNAAALANRVYNYMYGVTSFEEILNKGTDDIKSISVSE